MGKLAFVFAGQGAQSVGMGKDLYQYSKRVKELFNMAETKSNGIMNLMFSGSQEELNITINTQPCLFLADLACAIALSEKGIIADGTAGFSIGEIPAACYSGLMEKMQAFDFICYRAKVMHECAQQHKGDMFAILKLSSCEVENICTTLKEAYPVNYNCLGQTVVACACSTSEELQNAVLKAGGKAKKLAVSGAFHSPFMDAASESIATYLKSENLNTMHIPLYANRTAQIYDNPKKLLTQQVNHPVLWHKTVENMIADGFDTFIEVGSGKTLSGLIKRIAPDVKIYNVSDVESLENTVKEFNKYA